MDLSKILNLLYRYLWLFVLTILVASLTAFFVLNNQPPLYKTSTRLLVGASLDSPSPDAVKANLDQQNLIIKQLSDEHNHLSDALRTLATIYQVMLATDTNQLEIISPAEAAVAVDQNLLLRVAMAGASGLALTLIIIF